MFLPHNRPPPWRNYFCFRQIRLTHIANGCQENLCLLSWIVVHTRFSFGGGRGRGGWNFPNPLPETLKLSMVIIVLSQVLNNNLVPDCNLRESKFKILPGGACPQTPLGLVGMHAYHGIIILLPSWSSLPPTQNTAWNATHNLLVRQYKKVRPVAQSNDYWLPVHTIC